MVHLRVWGYLGVTGLHLLSSQWRRRNPLGNRTSACLWSRAVSEQLNIHFPSVMKGAHCCRPQVSDKDRDFAAAAAKQLEYQQFEDDKLSQKSSSSKLSRSPLKIVKRPKSMQCKVTLLDGSDYGCDVDVSAHLKAGSSRRVCKLTFPRTRETHSKCSCSTL